MKKYFIPITIVVIVVGLLLWQKFSHIEVVIENPPIQTPTEQPTQPTEPSEPTPPLLATEFKLITLVTDRPGAEIINAVGFKNAAAVLALNRIDDKHLFKGMTMVIPTSFATPSDWAFMPTTIEAATSIPKLAIVSQRTQSIGFYEYGKLVKSGPVSSGKKDTPTPSKLFFANWKGKEVTSTFDDEWVLKWNVNVANFEGVGIHYYAMPGYPASHSCVRLYEADAEWFYNWVDTWILGADGQTKIASGTPVFIYGEYNFGKTAPWKALTTNKNATNVTKDELNTLVTDNLTTIQNEQTKREAVLASLSH